MTGRRRNLGSACASHAGDGALAIANFFFPAGTEITLPDPSTLRAEKFVAAGRRHQRAGHMRSPELRGRARRTFVNWRSAR
jgi:hypothetical protein